jgi:succinate dehydrogenase / fumarate reductase cytochrome b subunit
MNSMRKKQSFFASSVGRKLIVGLSGFFLCLFLVFHLTVNLFLFKADGGKLFDSYAEFLATYPLLRPIEIVLFLLFLVHAIYALWLWYLNRAARPERYAVKRSGEVSTLSSRIMFITALVVLAFLVIHVNTFFVQSRFFSGENGPTMFERVATALADPVTDVFYILALIFLAFHLRHGFQSLFQTWGLRNTRYLKLIEGVAVIFWLLIPLGFALMPLYFLFRAH